MGLCFIEITKTNNLYGLNCTNVQQCLKQIVLRKLICYVLLLFFGQGKGVRSIMSNSYELLIRIQHCLSREAR